MSYATLAESMKRATFGRAGSTRTRVALTRLADLDAAIEERQRCSAALLLALDEDELRLGDAGTLLLDHKKQLRERRDLHRGCAASRALRASIDFLRLYHIAIGRVLCTYSEQVHDYCDMLRRESDEFDDERGEIRNALPAAAIGAYDRLQSERAQTAD